MSLDYDFLACRIMREFGWTIEYVLNLTFPVFLDLFVLIRRVRMDAAIDGFYTAYGAAKYGGKCAKMLFDGRGSTVLKPEKEINQKKITPAMLRKANAKLQAIIEAQQKKLAQAASGN